MVNAQEYIKQRYPDLEVKILDLESQELEDHLDLSEFIWLEELNCSHNELTSLDISKCMNLKKIDFSYNLFDDLTFLGKLPHPEKLIYLNIDECGVFISLEEKIKTLAPFVNLEDRWVSYVRLQENKEQLELKISELKEQNIQLQEENDSLKSDQQELEKRLIESQNQTKLTRKQRESVEETVQELKNSLVQIQADNSQLQNELKIEKATREALNKYQKELTDNLVERALLEERVLVRKEKIGELRQKLQTLKEGKKKAVEEQLRNLREELANFERQYWEKQKSESDLQVKLELLRQGPKVIKDEVKVKIVEVKRKIKSSAEEQHWLDNILEYHKSLFDLQNDEKESFSVKKELNKLKTKLLTSRNIRHDEVEKIRRIIEKSDKLIELREILRKVDKIETKEQEMKEELIRREHELRIYNLEEELNIGFHQENLRDYGLCQRCRQSNTGKDWCKPCNAQRFQKEFKNWTSGSKEIDQLIQKYQLEAINKYGVLEWINYEQFSNIEHLADGGFGKVYRAKWNNQEVVLKSLNNSQNLTIDFLQEITCHKLFSDKIHIVPCYGVSRDPITKNHVMVMKYVEGGNLRKYLQNNYNKLIMENKLFQLLNIIRGLKSIHEQGLTHRDFHSGNILNNSGKNGSLCYITDLGLCWPVDKVDKKGEIFGVLSYVAPEVLKGKGYSQVSDIYSFGMIVYEMLTGLPPHHESDYDMNLTLAICNGLRPKFDIKVPQLLEDLIIRCWDADPSKRPVASELEKDLLFWWSEVGEKKDTEFVRQVEKAEEFNKSLRKTISIPFNSEKYTSRLLLTEEINEQHSQLIDFTKINLESDKKEEERLEIQIPPKK